MAFSYCALSPFTANWIDWTLPAEKLSKLIKGLYPDAYTTVHKKRLKILLTYLIVISLSLLISCLISLFGAGKLPRVMGDVAKGIKNFKTGMKEEEDTEEASAKETVSVSKDKDNNTDSKDS